MNEKRVRTFRHVEARKKEFTISDASLSSTCVANHAGNQVANELDMLHKYFRSNDFRQ